MVEHRSVHFRLTQDSNSVVFINKQSREAYLSSFVWSLSTWIEARVLVFEGCGSASILARQYRMMVVAWHCYVMSPGLCQGYFREPVGAGE